MAKLTDEELQTIHKIFRNTVSDSLLELGNTMSEEGMQGIGCTIATRPDIIYDDCTNGKGECEYISNEFDPTPCTMMCDSEVIQGPYSYEGNASLKGIQWSPDGLSLITVYGNGGIFRQKFYSTPWDLSTEISETSYTTGQQYVDNFYIREDGLMLFTANNGSDYMCSYPLTSAWDITTIGNIIQCKLISSYIPSQTIWNFFGIAFDPTGTILTVYEYLQNSTGRYHSFYLNVEWDLTSIIYNGISPEYALNYHGKFAYSSDGKKIVAVYGNNLISYTLSTAWDSTTMEIDSCVYTDSLSSGAVAIGDDGKSLAIILGVSLDVYKIKLNGTVEQC